MVNLKNQKILLNEEEKRKQMEEKEDLLLEFLHAFENLNRQKKLLPKVLDCLLAHAITTKTKNTNTS